MGKEKEGRETEGTVREEWGLKNREKRLGVATGEEEEG